MMGPQHRALGALAGAALALVEPPLVVHGRLLPVLPVMLASSLLATVTAGGRKFSPDLDQAEWWVRLRDSYPGGQKIMGHRGVTHWWGWPAAALMLLAVLPIQLSVIPLAFAAGWASHIIGDAPFGRIPVLPYTGPKAPKIGGRLRTGGAVELYVVRWILPLATAAVIWQFGF